MTHEHKLMKLAYVDAEYLAEVGVFNIQAPFQSGAMNTFLDLLREEVKSGRSARQAGAFAKRAFMALNGSYDPLKPMLDAKPIKENAEKYAVTVKTAWEGRQLSAMVGGVSLDIESSVSTDDILLKINGTVSSIENSADNEKEQTKQEVADELRADIIKMIEGDKSAIIETGIDSLDRLIMGFQPSTHVIIAARPSVGKTALGLTLASNQDLAGHKVGFVTIEMTEKQCFSRLAQIRSGVSTKDFIKQEATNEQFIDFNRELDGIVNESSIQIRACNSRLSSVKRAIRKMIKAEPDLKVVYLDYIQLLNYGDSRMSPVQNIEECCKALTEMEKQLGICLVSLAQLNRDGSDKPKMRDIKGSGQLEQDAHMIILIDRNLEEAFKANASGCNEDLPAKLIVVKNRDGESGLVDIAYNAKQTKFYDPTYTQGEYYGS